jgi:hypothetical protein
MTSEDIAAHTRQFLRVKGNRISKIKRGVTGLPPEINGGESRKQQRDRIKRTCRAAEIFTTEKRNNL